MRYLPLMACKYVQGVWKLKEDDLLDSLDFPNSYSKNIIRLYIRHSPFRKSKHKVYDTNNAVLN